MSKEIYHTAILAALFLLLFITAEFLYHKLKIQADFTRKIVHFCTGIITMLFPVMLNNHWLVLLLCAGFALLLIISIKFSLLKSIHAISRFSYGSILYPVAVYFCYLAYDYFDKNLLFFYLPVLTLAVCDPVAALVGKRWCYGSFRIAKDNKTIMGSLAFFISSIVVTSILLYLLSTKTFNNFLPLIFIIAAASTVVEAVSVKGIDNITIPASVVLILILLR